jgi:hypothetical protein
LRWFGQSISRPLKFRKTRSKLTSIYQILANIEFVPKSVELAKIEAEIKAFYRQSFQNSTKLYRLCVPEDYLSQIGFENLKLILREVFLSSDELESLDSLTLFFEFLNDIIKTMSEKFHPSSSFQILMQTFDFLIIEKFEKISSETNNRSRNILIIKFLDSFTTFFRFYADSASPEAQSKFLMTYLSKLALNINPEALEIAITQISDAYLKSTQSYFIKVDLNRLSIERRLFEEFSDHFMSAFLSLYQMTMVRNRLLFNRIFGQLKLLFDYIVDNLRLVITLSQRLFLIDLLQRLTNQTTQAINEALAYAVDKDFEDEIGYLSSIKIAAKNNTERQASEFITFIERHFLQKLLTNKKLLYEFDEFFQGFEESLKRNGYDLPLCTIHEDFFKELGIRASSLQNTVESQPLNQNQIKEFSGKLRQALDSIIPKSMHGTFFAQIKH